MKTLSEILFVLILCECLSGCTANNKQDISQNIDKISVNSAVIPVPNPEKSIQEWWMPRHKAVNQKLAQGNVDILFIGNSIVNGFESQGKEVWAKYYQPRNAVNMGFGWDRTQHVLWRLENSHFGNINPKLAILLIGTNNIGRNTIDEIADGIKAICMYLKVHLPSTKILLLGIFPRFEETSADRNIISKINTKLAMLDDQKIIYFMDIGNSFLDENGKISSAVMHDLLHPTAKGYQIFAQAIEPKVKELLSEK